MKNMITLNWNGPFSFSELVTDNSIIENREGIYLFCLKNKSDYLIYYVGESNKLYDRLKKHNNEFFKGNYSLVNMEHYNLYNEINIINLGKCELSNFSYNTKEFKNKFKDEIIRNIDQTFVFIAYPFYEKPLFNFKGKVSQGIEGAIQTHLYRNQNTRQYLTTKISTYNLTGYKIINIYPDTININGLPKEIKTPLS